MIEINVSTLINCTQALNELIKKPLKIRTAYKIARLAREVSKELELFNNTKNSLIQKYGEHDENNNLITENNSYKIREDKRKEFVEEYQDMMQQTIQLNIEPITLKELENEEFTPQEISNIIDFIEE